MKTKRGLLAAVGCVVLGGAVSAAWGAEGPVGGVFEGHPAAGELARVFPPIAVAGGEGFKASGVTREAYVKLITGNVEFFKGQQRADGAIIDPVAKAEVQYSTPAFAASAGLLVRAADRKDLLEPASKALTCSINALVAKKTANNHPDFYIPLIMHAYASLKDAVPAETRVAWEKGLQAIAHRNVYRADLRKMNWNIVSSSGELLRRQAGMVAADQREDQWAYLEECLAGHVPGMTKFGLYDDPNQPLAYDAFSRLWLEDVMASGAYEGKLAAQIDGFLKKGGLTGLLLMSPQGEWASGGRSAFHQWNEAETAAICEMEAVRWKKLGRPEIAGSFKRAARLAVQSMARWQRPTGELNIVKNWAEPAARFGYESYSSHSQYNILPMAMLAMAYAHADEGIAEAPLPAETGGYVLDLRETFHKVVAAAGGYYVLIDTAADPHYNATGLQRIHRAGVTFSPLSDSAAGERAYGPGSAAKVAIAPGVEWKEGEEWVSLADFSREEKGAKRVVKAAGLKVVETTAAKTVFTIEYTLEGAGARKVVERYTVSASGVELAVSAGGGVRRVGMPALLNDGAKDLKVEMLPGAAVIGHSTGALIWKLGKDMDRPAMLLTGPKSVTHQGYVQALTAEVPAGVEEVVMGWTLVPGK